MNATALLAELEQRSVILLTLGDKLVVDAPRGVLTSELRLAIFANKAGLLRELRERPQLLAPNQRSATPLTDYAADRTPAIRFNLTETDDVVRDIQVVDRVRRVIQEHQPGGNHVYLTIKTLDRRRVTVEWRALATRNLRYGIARVLARAARPEASP